LRALEVGDCDDTTKQPPPLAHAGPESGTGDTTWICCPLSLACTRRIFQPGRPELASGSPSIKRICWYILRRHTINHWRAQPYQELHMRPRTKLAVGARRARAMIACLRGPRACDAGPSRRQCGLAAAFTGCTRLFLTPVGPIGHILSLLRLCLSNSSAIRDPAIRRCL
jgi:hypothetical protein